MDKIYSEVEPYLDRIISESPPEIFSGVALTTRQIKRNYRLFYNAFENDSILKYQLFCELPKEKYECWKEWAYKNHFIPDDDEVEQIKQRLWAEMNTGQLDLL